MPWIMLGVVLVILTGAVVYLIATRETEPRVVEAATETTSTPVVNGNGQPPAVGSEVVKYVVTTTNIRNIATAEGPDSRTLGSVPRGQQVRGVMVEGLSGDSFWFRLSDGRGYISAINLSDGPPGPESAPRIVVRAPVMHGSYCVVSTSQSSLRIRSSAGGPVVGGLPRGSPVQAFDQATGGGETWVYVVPQRAGYRPGWVAIRFLSC